jgi:hypothetical protein
MYLRWSVPTTALGHSSTHEKMTFLGRRFFEKGRRSGSCFDVH